MSALVCDTSALMAHALREPDGDRIEQCLLQAQAVILSSVTRVELGIVGESYRIASRIDEILAAYDVHVEPFDADQAALAIDAWRRFGKGRHAAGLNFGDCCAYALAQSLELPLLYKGGDFARTDVVPALV